MNNYLLENEIILDEKGVKDKVYLTNLRLRKISYKKKCLKSIFLENISSLEIKYKSYRIWIFLSLAFLLAVFPLFKERLPYMALMFLFFSLMFIIIYFLTRKSNIIVYSNRDSVVDFYIKGKNIDNVVSYINTIEIAIKERKEFLYKVKSNTI